MMTQPSMTPDEIAERRTRARHSALLLGVLVLVIFIGSIVFNLGHG
jgi:hypothetical protein